MTATVRSPLLSAEEFLSLGTLDDLQARYRERGFEGDRGALLLRAQEDWHRAALAEAKRLDPQAPASFDPIVVRARGLEVRVYGLIHGMVGGDDPTYKKFIDDRLSKLRGAAFENGFTWFYPHEGAVEIPDFAVLGVTGSLKVGLIVGLWFPILMWDLIREALKLGRFRSAEGVEELLDYSPKFHGLDPELRRGIEPDPPLPARLQIEHEMGEWERRWTRDAFAIVPRSLYMAGFAFGVAESRGTQGADLVVGDLHAMEAVRFLEGIERWEAHPLFASGRRFAKLPTVRRELTRSAMKLAHLLCAATMGCVFILPAIVLIFWLVREVLLA